MTETSDQIAAIRAFNRFYTRVIGLLDEGILKSPFSLAEARIIHEIGKLGSTSSSALSRLLAMDPGQLSRLVARLGDKALLAATLNPDDARVADLRLTETGTTAAVELSVLSDRAAETLLEPLSPSERRTLVAAMAAITAAIGGTVPAGTVLREQRIGELGWLIHRQGWLYAEEQGWDGTFEALIARLYAEFAEAPDAPPKKLWIAERDGAVAGSVFVMPNASDAEVAQLRMLYVEPWARGLGIGRVLVDEVVGFSRVAGYRSVLLWTQDSLVAARKIYLGAGFRLVREEKHQSFGKDLNGQYWELELTA